MQFIKSLVRGLFSLGLKVGILIFAISTSMLLVFGSSGPLKQSLKNSKIYDNVIDSALHDSTSHDPPGNTDISLTSPQVKQAAKTAFSPAYIQTTTEQVIDSVYSWLKGKTPKPDFKIDVAALKMKFADAAAQNAAARAMQLPACSLQQSRELANSKIDPFNMLCLPQGLDINTVREQVAADLATNDSFLKDPLITADTLPRDDKGKTFLDNIAEAPQIFHWLTLVPWVSAGFSVLMALGLLALHDKKRQAWHAIASTLLGGGIFLFISTWLVGYAFRSLSKAGGPLGKVAANGLQNNLLEVMHGLSNAVNAKLLIFATVYSLVGAALLLFLFFSKRIKQAAASEPLPNSDMPNELPAPTESNKKSNDVSEPKL